MTSRQYIGARYIPVFADPVEWDNTRPYEALMMVQHVGETYMSRQAVPIGADLPDTGQGEESNEFWVHMSNWNAQVETYRQEVLQYNGRISTLENDLPLADFDNVNTVSKAISDALALLPGTSFDSVNTVAKAISDLSDVIPESSFDSTNTIKKYIDDEVAKLPGTAFDSSNTVAKAIQQRGGFQGANIMCVTDSWGTEGSYGVTKSWMHIVCDYLHANYIDLHQGSTGYIAAPTFLTRVQNWCAAHPDEVDEVNYIFVCGSTNDASETTNNIRSAINNFVSWVSANMPNTTIILFPQFAGCDMNLGSVASNDYNVWQKIYYATAAQWLNTQLPNTVVIPNIALCLVGKNYMNPDNVHPTQAGHNTIANQVLTTLTGNTCKSCDLYGGIIDYKNLIKIYGRTSNAEITPNQITGSLDFDSQGCLQGNLSIQLPLTLVDESGFELRFEKLLFMNSNTLASQGIVMFVESSTNASYLGDIKFVAPIDFSQSLKTQTGSSPTPGLKIVLWDAGIDSSTKYTVLHIVFNARMLFGLR